MRRRLTFCDDMVGGGGIVPNKRDFIYVCWYHKNAKKKKFVMTNVIFICMCAKFLNNV